MVEPSAFIFLGDDETRKQERIELLFKKFFPPALKELNTQTLYGDDKRLTLAALKESLTSFPTPGAKKRLVVIRRAAHLGKPLRDCLCRQLRRASEKVLVVVDVPEARAAQDLVRDLIKAGAEPVRFERRAAAPKVFDLGRLILDQRPDRALEVLTALLRSRERSEKILGALSWQWDRFYSEGKLNRERYSLGLKFMGETDRRLKSSVSAYAREGLILEALVVKLSYLSC